MPFPFTSAFFLPAGGVWEEMRAGFGFAKKIFESPISNQQHLHFYKHLPCTYTLCINIAEKVQQGK